ncbi:MAG: Xaa-Pro peptidase family protein [Candidatus Methanoperedens sp.]|nr:Xaa-Pro peptidase family protein [Candidatus Methanoperedens sp.]
MKLNIPDADAYLMISESAHSADMYYATGFLAHDSFIYLNSKNEKLLISDMELGRAKKEAYIKEVLPTSAFGIMEKLRALKDIDAAYNGMILEFLRSENIKRIAVPYNFPIYIADILRRDGIDVIPVKSPFRKMREVKNDNEIKAIEKAQRAGEKALTEAIGAIRNATVGNGVLWHNNAPLTSEKITSIIDTSLLSGGFEAPDPIVACGRGSADPHWQGEGELRAGEQIVIDFVPRSKNERYYSDMTRTVVRGTPSDEIKEMYSAVRAAQEAAIRRIKAGITGNEVHNIVCDVLEARGYETSRGKTGVFTEGFIHSTGHGVGLDIHEGPNLSESGKELNEGSVVTVEPGLYYKDIGGVRLEDVVVVTASGCKNLTMFEKNLVLE